MSDTTPQQSQWPPAIAAITLFVKISQSQSFEDEQSAVFRFGEQLVDLLHSNAAPELIELTIAGVPWWRCSMG